jgi:hypothetical protein
VRQGVEGDAAEAAGQAVAHAVGYVGVGELVEGDADDEGGDQGSEEDKGGEGVDVQQVEIDEDHSVRINDSTRSSTDGGADRVCAG